MCPPQGTLTTEGLFKEEQFGKFADLVPWDTKYIFISSASVGREQWGEYGTDKEACELLDIFGILEKRDIKPNKLSGGEQQRVASARALINKPDLILADEMTGNLDEDTSDEIINFFLKFIKSNNISLLYVTHNQKYADMANNKYEFKNKKLILK